MKKTIAIALISIFTLAGCSLFGEEAPQASEEKTADTILDDQFYQFAVDHKDSEKCEKISVSEKADECKEVVEAVTLTAKAKEAMDASACDDIKLERYKENCEDEVEVVIAKSEQEEKRQETEQEAVDTGDASLCDELADEDKYSCRYNVLANLAIDSNNPAICDQIGNEQFAKECKNNLEMITD